MMVLIPYLHNFEVKIGWKFHLCQGTKRGKLSLTLSNVRSGSHWLSPSPHQYLVPNQYLRLSCMTKWLTVPNICSVLFCIDRSGLPLPGRQPNLLCDNPSIYAFMRLLEGLAILSLKAELCDCCDHGSFLPFSFCFPSISRITSFTGTSSHRDEQLMWGWLAMSSPAKDEREEKFWSQGAGSKQNKFPELSQS